MLNNIHNITAKAFLELIIDCDNIDNQVILDVRTKAEYDESHIINSINIDFLSPHFVDKIEKLDRDKLYLIYCRSGHRSGISENNALELMVQQGFSNVYNMRGGILSFITLPNAAAYIE